MPKPMRVIAGKYRRRQLKNVPGAVTRSTKDRVKESLFNMMMPYLPGKRALDAFAGSGALGIEGLSRGLASCDFIERDKDAYDTLIANLKTLEIDENVQTIHDDTLHTLRQLKNPYDIIILDPPYNVGMLEETLDLINENALLKSQGFILILCGKAETFTIPTSLTRFKKRTVGITQILILENGGKS